MQSGSDNRKKLKDFFGREYQSIKTYVYTKVKDTTNRSAEDIVQDVALKLFSGADRYAPINNVAGFVYRSLKNKIIDVMRTSNSTEYQEIDTDFPEEKEDIFQVQGNYSLEEMSTLLKECVEQLKPMYRDIIIAVDFKGYSYTYISNKTGIPKGTLMSRRHRAIGILYKKLKSSNIKTSTL